MILSFRIIFVKTQVVIAGMIKHKIKIFANTKSADSDVDIAA